MILRTGDFDLCQAIHPKLQKFNPAHSGFLNTDVTLDIPHDKALMGYMIWFMDLAEDDILSISRRLDFSADMSHAVWAVAQLKKSLPFLINSKPSVWTFALEKLPLLSIYTVYLVSREHALLDYLSIWRHVKPRTTGDDLKARGLIPGPRFGEILLQLRAGWLDGEISSPEQEQDLLQRLIKLKD
jgi:tRNA nucleotidyltransferase (CCA-adding enzyme)